MVGLGISSTVGIVFATKKTEFFKPLHRGLQHFPPAGDHVRDVGKWLLRPVEMIVGKNLSGIASWSEVLLFSKSSKMVIFPRAGGFSGELLRGERSL